MVVEDGTIVDGANSYVPVSYADKYFEDRGNTTWAGATDDAKEQALIRATDYVDNRFTFKGSKVEEDQPLQFPREEGVIPVNLKKAVSEYAVRALGADLAPDPTVDPTGLQVTAKTEEVGPLKESVTYSESKGPAPFVAYPAADMLLRSLVDSANRVIR